MADNVDEKGDNTDVKDDGTDKQDTKVSQTCLYN